jgi:hypothetical protein
MTARHWRTIIAIRMPIGLRQNSSSSLMGKPLETRSHDNSYQDKYQETRGKSAGIAKGVTGGDVRVGPVSAAPPGVFSG